MSSDRDRRRPLHGETLLGYIEGVIVGVCSTERATFDEPGGFVETSYVFSSPVLLRSGAIRAPT